MAEGPARIAAAFAGAERPLFIPYVMGGYPDPATSAEHAAALARHADVLELGVPFSDPLADGPTIQAAGGRALRAGTRPETVIDIAASLRGGPPVVLMTYVNAILAAGPRAFCERAARAGVAGVIVPDLPVDEAEVVRAPAARAGLAVIPLAAPTTTDARLAAIGRVAEGFLYCVSVTGVTGGEVRVGDELREFLDRARAVVPVPLAVGFGVRTPAQAAAIGGFADAVVMASALIRLVEEAEGPADVLRAIDALAQEVTEALAGVPAPPGVRAAAAGRASAG
jgi:tryptophan synthase alpha chain